MNETDQSSGKWWGGILLLVGVACSAIVATDLLASLLVGEAIFIYHKGGLTFFGMEAIVMSGAILVVGVLLAAIGWRKYRHG